jgi:hypothetical protein
MAYINLRDVKPKTHEVLVERARQAHMSLTAYVSRLLDREAETPEMDEIFERARKRGRRSTATFADKQQALREVRGE